MEVADIRRKFRARLEEARRKAEARRVAADLASRDYETFLEQVATPAFRTIASVLSAEGHPFKISTPAGGVRLSSASARDDYIELELDTEVSPPQVIGRVNRTRGGRRTTIERPVREGVMVADLREEDIVEFVVAEIEGLV